MGVVTMFLGLTFLFEHILRFSSEIGLNVRLGIVSIVQVTPRTEEECLKKVSKNGMYLRFIPDRMKTVEICVAAVSQTGRALEYVPEGARLQLGKGATTIILMDSS